jgi:DNA-binding NarL/FixJ family response regulator
LLCQECPKKPFCSQLCPEAELYADQDQTRQKEFSIPNPRYGIIPEGIDQVPPITNKERQILALLRGGLCRKEICKLLRITRKNLRVRLTMMKCKFSAFPPFLSLIEGQKSGTVPKSDEP